MVERRKSGIVVERGPLAMCWSTSPESRILKPWYGGGPRFQVINKELRCWVHRLVTSILHLRNVTESNGVCWNEFPWCKTCNQRGCCSSTVLLHATITSSVVCTLAVESYARSHDENIWQCLGRVLHRDLSMCSDEIGRPPHCPSFLEGLASEALTV